MNYRENPKNGDRLSILGYGCMRLPTRAGGVDEERATKQIRSAVDAGVNYFDTAYVYHGGRSESVLGGALAGGYREKVKIATKLPPFMVRKSADMEKIFSTQLKRLQTDHIDYYLIHMLQDTVTFERLCALGLREWIAEKKKSGQIVNIGFSFHGAQEQFLKLVDIYPWDFCQIQYNFLDENNQAGTKGLEYAASKGMPVIIMEPLRGGKIVNALPAKVDEIWASAEPKRSAAEWALRWVWNHKEATVLLSGMGTEEQIEQNIRIASDAQADVFTPEQLSLFDRVREILRMTNRVDCTGCRYCMPCPAGVDIPACFSSYNEKYMLRAGHPRMQYMQNTGVISGNPGYASLCRGCGKCEQHCPQGIPIREKLREVSHELEGPLFRPVVGIASLIFRAKK